MSEWARVAVLLERAAEFVTEASELAAEELRTIPSNDPKRGKFDPRRSVIAAAKFATALSHQAEDLQRKAERLR